MIPFIDLKGEYCRLRSEISEAIEEVLASGTYILGPNVAKLEEEISQYCGVSRGVAVANGTDALFLTLKALGVGPRDEVITTPYTFFATAEVISQLGATPVFVDIQDGSLNLDPEQIEAKVNARTKAILPVHIFGQPADMDEINVIAARHGIAVVEDACQAIGSEYKGKKTGSLARAGCFSFFPTKNLGCYGDGGMVVTNDEELANTIQLWRAHGSRKKYFYEALGYNSRLDEIQAVILRIKLGYLERWNRERGRLADLYATLLKNVECKLQQGPPHSSSVWNLFVIRTPDRDKVERYLQSKGVGVGTYYPLPLHLQEVYRCLGYSVGSLPIAEHACQQALALPLYPGLGDEQVRQVATLVSEAIG